VPDDPRHAAIGAGQRGVQLHPASPIRLRLLTASIPRRAPVHHAPCVSSVTDRLRQRAIYSTPMRLARHTEA
jgi:hypothetical protein